MIRVLHTADWHIGHTFFGYDRTAEHLHFFEWLNNQLTANRVNALLVAGDVFDSMNPSAASQKMLFNFIRNAKKANPDLQMVFIAGNHDSAGRLEAPMPLLEDMDVTVRGQLMKVKDEPILDEMIVPLKGDSGQTEALCLLIPHMYQSGNSKDESVSEYYAQLLRRTAEIKESKQALVILGYLNIAEKDDAFKSDTTNDLKPVSADIFGETMQYAGLGYKHSPHYVNGCKHIRYAGSPLPLTFEERGLKRSCMLLTMPDKHMPILEKLEYKPMTRLLSIPEVALKREDEIMELLAQLPDKGRDAYPPFLEVRVLITEPDPMLRMRIEKAVENKNVRLARIVTVFQNAGERYTEEEVMTAGLRDMSPMQIARIAYEKAYQEEMPSELEKLFDEICAVIN